SSQWLIQRELRQKGVGADIIEQVTGTVDDGDSAYRAARNRARRLPRADYADFQRRLGGYLRRRGFGYGVIKSTVNRLWQEAGAEAGGEPV
ncbi:MAG: RecX family transcriptional regulator, partial [Chloroflexota bacterium]